MPISRGSIRHNLGEDAFNFAWSVIQPTRVGRRASGGEKKALLDKIRAQFAVDHAVLFPYARSAFYSILKALDLPKGSEILLTPITIGPMLEVVTALGHVPVFVDVELNTYCADLNDLRAKLASHPPCFLLTYLFGYTPDIASIRSLCDEAGTFLIEDISHNIGSRVKGKPLGTFGVAAIHSASLLKYVDGYNGAFALTHSDQIRERLEADVAKFCDPDPRRIAKIIRTTVLWNFCLRRVPFNLFVFPLLWLIKTMRPQKFEQILGPKIALEMDRCLPQIYFEDIAGIQCKTIGRHLDGLEKLIASRQESAALVIDAFREILGESITFSTHSKENTYWQFVVPVDNLFEARNALFKHGVETGATGLMNLAAVTGVGLPGANALKDKHIFIPIHRWMSLKKYVEIFRILKPFLQLTKRGAKNSETVD